MQAIVSGDFELAGIAYGRVRLLVSCVSVVWKWLRVKPLLCLAGNNNRKIMISAYLEDQEDCPRTPTDVLM